MKKFTVIVKKAFPDRYTGIKHTVGDKLTIDENRYLEIRRSGDYVEIEKGAAKVEKNDAAPVIKK